MEDPRSLVDILSCAVIMKLDDGQRKEIDTMFRKFAENFIDQAEYPLSVLIAKVIVDKLVESSDITIDTMQIIINNYPRYRKYEDDTLYGKGVLLKEPEEGHDDKKEPDEGEKDQGVGEYEDEDEDEEEQEEYDEEEKTLDCQVSIDDVLVVNLLLKKMGLHMKENDKEAILKNMVMFLYDSDCFPYSISREACRCALIGRFMPVVQRYMMTSRTLDNVEVVRDAIEVVRAGNAVEAGKAVGVEDITYYYREKV